MDPSSRAPAGHKPVAGTKLIQPRDPQHRISLVPNIDASKATRLVMMTPTFHTDAATTMDHASPTRSHRPAASSIGRIDEGFSEAMDIDDALPVEQTPEPSEIDHGQQSTVQYSHWRNSLLQLPIDLRANLFRDLMDSLPTSKLYALIKEADPRLYLDPTKILPAELSIHFFKYLTPSEVIKTARVSRTWRACANQPTIWRRLFALEGWHVRPEAVREFENNVKAQLELYLSRDRSADEKMYQHRVMTRARTRDGGGKTLQQDLEACMLLLHDTSRTDVGFVHNSTLAERLWVAHGCLGTLRSVRHQDGPDAFHNQMPIQILPAGAPEFCRPNAGLTSPLLYPDSCWNWRLEQLQLNWHHLFVQRQRLARNWQAGACKTFRIPRLDHHGQRHTECIYTLQFSAKHVVSGSRDRTIRIWDLETQALRLATPQLRGQPVLYGHKGSVLCLQFDETPERDIIISGGSDSCLIMWKFSTGEVLKHIKKAHSQAVLNLRFDDRYLVTCSKDSSIKIWNMKRLSVTDDAYPAQSRARDATYPDYIVDKQALDVAPNLGLSPPIEPFTHIMTLNGHTAAVNAISMFKDEIVSVSGDRKVMRWNLTTGTLLKTYFGHEKGIACVHYDGRRIVSGSSDETIRIFDPISGAELHEKPLKGHRDLVRTLQADFGDIPGDEELYEARAKAYTEQSLSAKRKRLFNEIRPGEHATQASSRDLEGPYITGAKLPPGGGGSRWAKIVSGSYDETVIIWAQNSKGRWIKSRELRHEDAVNATAGQPPRPPPPGPPRRPPAPGHGHRPAPATMAQGFQQSLARLQRPQQAQQQQTQQHPMSQNGNPLSSAYGSHMAPVPTTNIPTAPPGHPAHQQSANAPGQPLPAQPQPQPQQTLSNQPQTQMHGPQQQQPQEEEEGTSRLFKLQFDARRIICCSQQQVIVGWDFANGDKDIIEASQFFEETL